MDSDTHFLSPVWTCTIGNSDVDLSYMRKKPRDEERDGGGEGKVKSKMGLLRVPAGHHECHHYTVLRKLFRK